MTVRSVATIAALSVAAAACLAAGPSSSSAPLPSHVLNLTDWKLQLPIGPAKNATEIPQPDLATYTSQYFHVNAAGDGVVLTAPVGGSTTSGSEYPRSELREMTGSGGKTEAGWSNAGTAVSTMTVSESVDMLPPVSPQVVVAQIHNSLSGSKSDPIEIVADGRKPTEPGTVKLGVRWFGKEQSAFLNPAYVLGTRYTLTLTATDGKMTVAYDGTVKSTFSETESGLYFKAGCYTQSNPSKGDKPTSYGQVTIYSLTVSHT
jgi:hypothetical protein